MGRAPVARMAEPTAGSAAYVRNMSRRSTALSPQDRMTRLDQALTTTQILLVTGLPGGEVHRIGPALVIAAPAPLRSMNGVFRYEAGAFSSPRDARELECCLAVVSSHDVPWRFNVWEHTGGGALAEQLMRRGLVMAGGAAAMWLDLPGPCPAPAAPRGWEVRLVRTPEDRQDWSSAFLRTFGLPAALEPMTGALTGCSGCTNLVGYVDGVPSATLTCCVAGDVAQLCHIGVHPAARGRGLGRLMVTTGQALAAARGATGLVVIHPGRLPRLCHSLGYTEMTRVAFLVRPNLSVPRRSATSARPAILAARAGSALAS
jgi:ribosomal protein S18 acetylase RimI-like enzyme